MVEAYESPTESSWQPPPPPTASVEIAPAGWDAIMAGPKSTGANGPIFDGLAYEEITLRLAERGIVPGTRLRDSKGGDRLVIHCGEAAKPYSKEEGQQAGYYVVNVLTSKARPNNPTVQCVKPELVIDMTIVSPATEETVASARIWHERWRAR